MNCAVWSGFTALQEDVPIVRIKRVTQRYDSESISRRHTSGELKFSEKGQEIACRTADRMSASRPLSIMLYTNFSALCFEGIVIDGNPFVEDVAAAAPLAFLFRHLFKVPQDPAPEVVDLFKPLLQHEG